MRTIKRRLLPLLLALALCLGLLPTTALADEGDFVIENGVLTKYTGPGGDVVIPDGVTAIGRSAFWDRGDITSVAIPSGVTSIDYHAFGWCVALASIELPSGLTSIGEGAFLCCENLKDVTIPNTVTTIGKGAFQGCICLGSITIPDSVTSIGEYAFSSSGLRSVVIPDSVTSMGAHAFDYCESLTSLVIGSGINDPLKEAQVTMCSALGKLTIKGRVSSIYYNSFNADGKLYEIHYAGTIEEFQNALKEGMYDKTVSYIGPNGFNTIYPYTALARAPRATVYCSDGSFSGSSGSGANPGGTTNPGTTNPCANGHSYDGGEVTKPATCTAYGTKTYTCTVCGKTKTESVARLEHSYDGGTVTKPATCTDNGTKTYTCTLCGKTKTESVARLEHSYDSGTVTKQPTANAQGVRTYTCTLCGRTKTESIPKLDAPAVSFTDVPNWCSDAVSWAVGKGITKGTGDNKFSPDDKCKGTEILTFLFRASGEAAPAAASPFTVASYYQDAVNWAWSKGFIDSSFAPDAPCTRASAVKFIWLALNGGSAPSGGFADVPAGADYAAAVDWAASIGITNGYGNSQFRPANTCSRGEIVTFLHRAYVPEVRLG